MHPRSSAWGKTRNLLAHGKDVWVSSNQKLSHRCCFEWFVGDIVDASEIFVLHSLERTNRLWQWGPIPQGNDCLPTIHFQWQNVSFGEGSWYGTYNILYDKYLILAMFLKQQNRNPNGRFGKSSAQNMYTLKGGKRTNSFLGEGIP